ncbi:hypothetical protein BCR44DRAFT_43895 [Catenaria anguillulae PL171]|uniref:Uncharacterized protein n=1 Tax=Catenaria anguillulae PL171 TaxID=765915 RepID=A0A1Y2I583_9FUNG|nr:hypothetical protein BCR44DRAFT_43895 [Catenaria anguillulae PL171]
MARAKSKCPNASVHASSTLTTRPPANSTTMFFLRPLTSLMAGSRSLLTAMSVTPTLAAARTSVSAAVSSSHQFRSVAWLPHGKNKSKSTRYQTMLKAKRRRQRRGKTGGPKKDVKSFSRFVGFRKEITFLPRKLGFQKAFLKDDPSLVVPIELPAIASSPKSSSVAPTTAASSSAAVAPESAPSAPTSSA